jgi:hypothetical protein
MSCWSAAVVCSCCFLCFVVVCSFSWLPEKSRHAPIFILLLIFLACFCWKGFIHYWGYTCDVGGKSLHFCCLCVLKKIENIAVAVGRSTSLCRHIFTSRERLLKAFNLVQKNYLITFDILNTITMTRQIGPQSPDNLG